MLRRLAYNTMLLTLVVLLGPFQCFAMAPTLEITHRIFLDVKQGDNELGQSEYSIDRPHNVRVH